MTKYISAILFMATTVLCAQNNDEIEEVKPGRPDSHAPISVMGDHTHNKGEFMFSYRFMTMNMEELISGDEDTSFSSVLVPNGGRYMVTPTKMPMQMHMLGSMYAPSNKMTLMAMINYISMEMDHITGMGGVFETKSSGFGDTKLAMLYNLYNKGGDKLHGQVGVSLPTGTIDGKDVTPASNGADVILPYPMQIGSGTFDAEFGLTFFKICNRLSFGSQLKGVFRLGENNNGYRLGNRFGLNNWLAVKANNWISFSVRLEGLVVDGIKGVNSSLNPMMVITADTNNSGGTFINSGLGFNILVPNGVFKDLRFAFEYAMPLLQDVNGVQLKTKETITLGLQYAL